MHICRLLLDFAGFFPTNLSGGMGSMEEWNGGKPGTWETGWETGDWETGDWETGDGKPVGNRWGNRGQTTVFCYFDVKS